MLQPLNGFLFHPVIRGIRLLQFALALSIFVFVALMPSSFVGSASQSDGVLHFIGNFLLFSSAAVAFLNTKPLKLIFICLVPFSLLVELAQWFSPSRQVDPRDMLYNISGLLSALAISYCVAFTYKWLYENKSRLNAL